MSERKSWDVQPKRRPAPPQETPARKPEPVRAPQNKPSPHPRAAERAPSRPSPRRAPTPSGTLRERRSRRRRTIKYVFLTILILLIASALYIVWLPSFRIASVSAQGPGADAAKQIALSKITGTYFHLVPHNSIFFYPQQKIRAAILDAVPEATAVSLKRDSFRSIVLSTIPRTESFIWCGTDIDTPDPEGCYDADAQGFIFKLADSNPAPQTASTTAATSTSTPSKNTHEKVRVFAPLDHVLARGQSPIRAHIVSASRLPDALKFAAAMRDLSAPVSSLAIHDDEADLWLGGPTRITYVLGQETQAASVAASVLPTLNLTNGSIQYVDLRFPGKAYVKRYGE